MLAELGSTHQIHRVEPLKIRYIGTRNFGLYLEVVLSLEVLDRVPFIRGSTVYPYFPFLPKVSSIHCWR